MSSHTSGNLTSASEACLRSVSSLLSTVLVSLPLKGELGNDDASSSSFVKLNSLSPFDSTSSSVSDFLLDSSSCLTSAIPGIPADKEPPAVLLPEFASSGISSFTTTLAPSIEADLIEFPSSVLLTTGTIAFSSTCSSTGDTFSFETRVWESFSVIGEGTSLSVFGSSRLPGSSLHWTRGISVAITSFIVSEVRLTTSSSSDGAERVESVSPPRAFENDDFFCFSNFFLLLVFFSFLRFLSDLTISRILAILVGAHLIICLLLPAGMFATKKGWLGFGS
mmetsp:Transcript_13647/g.39866  ORF Transcript_13647/g.39866 Transcript_13647/m.39866 type:complete len:279 (+) Transcript_13647:1527-2363(+)